MVIRRIDLLLHLKQNLNRKEKKIENRKKKSTHRKCEDAQKRVLLKSLDATINCT